MIATTKQTLHNAAVPKEGPAFSFLNYYDNIMTSSQARNDEIATSATRSTRYPRERVRAEHGGAGGAVPAAAPAASKSVARSSASLGLHGAAALPEMSERKGTAVDRQAGKNGRPTVLL